MKIPFLRHGNFSTGKKYNNSPGMNCTSPPSYSLRTVSAGFKFATRQF